ncbi:MAG: MATE family efflux transporter [Firmicutes bacterium]|nr:MATE family efflux transporter [Bacillota bacterium]
MTEERLDKNTRLLYRALIKVALPIALQSLIGSSLNLVDNMMVGSLGEGPLAAVGVGVQIFLIFWMICYGFCSGCATFMAQFWGAKDLPHIRRTIGFAFTCCVTVGLIFTLVCFFAPGTIMRIFTNIPEIIQLGIPYVKVGSPCFVCIAVAVPFETALRATQQTHIPLFVSIIVFSSNTFLNYIFIFGHFGAPRLGVAGAALATTIARIIQVAAIIFVVFIRKNEISGRLPEFFGWQKKFVTRVIRNSLPTTFNEMLWALGFSMYVAAFARIGATEYAAVQASNTIQNLLQMAGFSIGDALLILVGQRLGEGKLDEAFGLAKRLLRIAVTVGIIFGGLLILIAKPVLRLFAFTPEGNQYAFYILIVYGATMVFTLYNGINITGVLRCGGDTRFAMLVDVGSVWCIGVPLAFLSALVFHWPIFFCVLAVKVEEITKCGILTYRFLSKKWVRNVIHNIDD